MATVDFWFEFASTYSYPAALRIEALAEAEGVEIRWRPFLLGPIFRDQGWEDSPFNLQPEKGRYMWRDLERICEARGLPWRRPSVFPRNGLHAARIACRFAQAPWLPDFVRAVYRANFEDDRDIAEAETLAHCLAEAGQDAERPIAEANTPDNKDRLRAETEEARRLQIFGAPTFAVSGELFWGNDRLEDAVAWAKRA